jgi:hypothetical protein
MKSDYVWLRYFNHPLYTVEYPSIFGSFNENACKSHFLGDTVAMGSSRFSLFYERDYAVVSQFYVTVEKNDNKWVMPSSTNSTTKKITVSGITADYYLETVQPVYTDLTGFASSNTYKSKIRVSWRRASFWCDNLFWTIGMNWYFESAEPREAQLYFDHIIDTFKIIDTEPAGLPPVHDLNLQTIFYPNTLTFEIKNNEKYDLREVHVYINYQGDNLSSGYHSLIFVGLDQGDTITLSGLDFTDSKGNYFKYMSNHVLNKIMVTAEYPGYVKKIFTREYTWDGKSLK